MVKFSDRMVAGLRPQAKEYRVTEGNGFVLRVRPSGVKIWTYRYRCGSRNIMLTLGHYPAMSLADARKDHADACHLRQRGGDPAAEKRERGRLTIETVEDLARVYIEEWAKPRKRSWKEDERTLNVDVLPVFRHVKLKDLSRRAVIDALKQKAKTAPNQAWQTLKVLRRMFNFALEQDYPGIKANPCTHIKLMPPTPKERALGRDEIRTLWAALTVDGIGQTAAALKLILLTGQRPGEVIGMHRGEIDGSWWTIPAERSKNKRAHRVYLTETALALVGDAEGFIFPKEVAPDQPAASRGESALRQYLNRRLKPMAKDKRLKGAAGRKRRWYAATAEVERGQVAKLPLAYFTPHDLRRTAATRMAEVGIAPHMLARVLNHIDRSVTAMHYNLYTYDLEKRTAMERWETELLGMVAPRA